MAPAEEFCEHSAIVAVGTNVPVCDCVVVRSCSESELRVRMG
jgi:hypothetical protein